MTEHKYTADRLMYKEGMKLAARLEEEEAALKQELQVCVCVCAYLSKCNVHMHCRILIITLFASHSQPVYGDNVNVAQHQKSPLSPVQRVLNRTKVRHWSECVTYSVI